MNLNFLVLDNLTAEANTARDFVWSLVHNGCYHNESIYRKWEHDKKLLESQQQTPTQVTDIEEVDISEAANSENEDESDEEQNELVDDPANLRVIEKKGIFFSTRSSSLIC